MLSSPTPTSKTITHLNFASGYRGGERQTTLLIQTLANKGFKQQLFTRQNSELADRCSHIDGLEIIKIAKPYILSFAKFKNAQILHAHETKGAQVAFLINKIYSTPYLITRRVDNTIKQNAFTKAMYKNASYCIALSKAISDILIAASPASNTVVIPSAQTNFEVNQTSVDELKLRFAGKFLIGNIGELENKHKGQFYLIEAIKKIALEYPDIHFIFLGKGADKEKYQAQASGLDNVTFEGYVNNVADYINCMQLFVFPSLNEGLGSILLDVMKCKVPVIASNVGGIPDIVHHNETGILVPPKDSDAIYNNIIELYNNKQLASRLSDNAYQNTFNYTPESMAQAYIKLYTTL